MTPCIYTHRISACDIITCRVKCIYIYHVYLSIYKSFFGGNSPSELQGELAALRAPERWPTGPLAAAACASRRGALAGGAGRASHGKRGTLGSVIGEFFLPNGKKKHGTSWNISGYYIYIYVYIYIYISS